MTRVRQQVVSTEAERPTIHDTPNKPRRRRRVWRQLPTHLVLVPVCLVWIYPFVWMISTGFKSTSEYITSGLAIMPDEPTFENFVRAWGTARFGQYTVNTLIIAASVAVLVVVVSALAGYALGRGDLPGRKLIVGVLVLTMFLPRGYTILPIFVVIKALGLNNTLFGVILAESGPAHVIAILLFMGYFHQLPRELEDSAVVDGAGYWRTFFSVMAPLAKPVAATVFIFNFISAWNSFLFPLVLTLGAPNLRTVGVGMFNFKGELVVDFTGLAAAGVISVLPVIVVFAFLQRYFIEGIAGAVKQ